MKSAQPHARAASRPAAAASRGRPSRTSATKAAPAPGPEPEPPCATRRVYIAATGAAALWIVGLSLAVAPLQINRHALILAVLLALGPAALLFALAYIVRQGDRLTAVSLGPDDQGVSLFGPALRAAAGAGGAADGVQSELAAATAAAGRARDDLEALRLTLSDDHGGGGHLSRPAGELSLAERMQSERHDLAAMSEALDAQLAAAAKLVEDDLARLTDAAAAAAAQFDEADRALEARARSFVPAVAKAADVARDAGAEAGRRADQLERHASRIAAQAQAWAGSLPAQSEAVLAAAGSVRLEREGLFAEARGRIAHFRAFVDRVGAAASELGSQLLAVGGALLAPQIRSPEPASSAAESAAPVVEPSAESSSVAPGVPAVVEAAAPAAEPARCEPAIPAPILTARGIGGQIAFDGSRILIDRTQSASFVMHGAVGQRAIQLREVIKIRFVPPRRGAHGYLQFVLGRDGRGGPADVNSILFDASQQASFRHMADELNRAARHLRRHPDASDPRAPGEMAHLMDLRGRGLIDAEEFAAASARLSAARRGPLSWLQRRSRD